MLPSMDPAPRFVLFGPAHVVTLAAAGAAAWGLARLARRGEGASRIVRTALSCLLLGATAAYLFAVARTGRLTVWDLVPLHLCDFLIFVAVGALLTRRLAATELLYFWACTGTLLAMVTPDLSWGFPDWRYVTYFVLHGAVVAAAVVLVFGEGLRPRPGAAWRAFLLTNAYAAMVYVVNVAFDKNFLYLRRKPYAPTLLDWMGPWPVYILVVEAVALALFAALELPFRVRRLRPAEPNR
jgi:hypothetical integral membrane protein (TIGR02206 family)